MKGGKCEWHANVTADTFSTILGKKIDEKTCTQDKYEENDTTQPEVEGNTNQPKPLC